jgi:hypothetical protein
MPYCARVQLLLKADARARGILEHGAAPLPVAPEATVDSAELVRRHGPMVLGVCRNASSKQANRNASSQIIFFKKSILGGG